MIKREGQDPLQYTITRRNRQRVYGSRDNDIMNASSTRGYKNASYSPSRNSSGHSSPAGGDTDCSDQDEDYENNNMANLPDNNVAPGYNLATPSGIGFHNYSCVKLPPVAHTITIPTTEHTTEIKEEHVDDYVNGVLQQPPTPTTMVPSPNAYQTVKLEVSVTPSKYGSIIQASPVTHSMDSAENIGSENVFGCFNMLVDVAIAQLHEIENKQSSNTLIETNNGQVHYML